MKKKFKLIFTGLFLVGILTISFAQQRGDRQGPSEAISNKGLIRGKVLDAASQSPLEFATITLFSAVDSSIVTGAITDPAGSFELEASPGLYYAKIEFISYQPRLIGDLQLTEGAPNLDLGTFQLTTDATVLSEVEVRAEKSQMQMSLDKKVFNVGKDLANNGGSAAEVLDNVPSVTVDVEGNVSLRGSGNVRILIDGKPSGLIGIGNADGLRSIPSNLIERVEVITNPSARYEAEGMSGIINIVLRKERKRGLNGSFDVTAGVPEQYGAAINLNYRKKNLNLFTNYGIRYRNNTGKSNVYQEFYDGDTTFITEQDRDRTRQGWSNNLRLGADYFFNEKNVLTTSFIYGISNEDNLSNIEYLDFVNNLNNPTGTTRRTDDEKEDETELEYRLNYKRTFDRKGQELTMELNYEDNTETEGSDFIEKYFLADGSPANASDLLQRSSNNESSSRLLIQADYVHPFTKEGKFEVGYRSTLRQIDNDYLVEEFADNVWVSLEGLSNNFEYDENIHALYGIVGNKQGRFSYQMGLRAELSDVKTALLQTNEVNDRRYTNLFPSAHLTYDLGDDNAIQISYSRRIRRPRFWDLNPFFTFSDSRNFFSGNPNLDPEFTNAYELGHVKYWEKASISSSIYYRHTDDVIERVLTVNQDGRTVRMPQNLATEDNFGMEFTFSIEPEDWWKVDGDVNFFRSITNGQNINQSFEADTYTLFGRVSSKMTLWKKLDFQMRLHYVAPRENTQGRQLATYFADMGLSYDVFNNKGTLTLSGRDVFNTRRRRGIVRTDRLFRRDDFQWRRGQITLTLNYRLNQNKRRNRGGERGDGEFDGGEGQEF